MVNRNLDKIFEEGLNNTQSFGNAEASWSSIEADLDINKNKKKRNIIWLFLSSALLLISVFAILNMNKNSSMNTHNAQESENLNYENQINSKMGDANKEDDIVHSDGQGSDNHLMTEIKQGSINTKTDFKISHGLVKNGEKELVQNQKSIEFENSKIADRNSIIEISYLNTTIEENPIFTYNVSNESQAVHLAKSNRVMYQIPTHILFLSIPERKVHFNQNPTVPIKYTKTERSKKWDIGFEIINANDQSNLDYNSNVTFVPKLRFEIFEGVKIGLFAYQIKENFALSEGNLSIGFPIPDNPFYAPAQLQSVTSFRNNFRVGLDLTCKVLQVGTLGLSFKGGVVSMIRDENDMIYSFEGSYVVESIEDSFIDKSINLRQYFIGSEIDVSKGPFSLYGTISYNSSFPNTYFRHQFLQLGFGSRFSF